MSRSEGKLSGRSRLVAGDPYELFVLVPKDWRLDGVRAEGAEATGTRVDGAVHILELVTKKGGEASWTLSFSRAGR